MLCRTFLQCLLTLWLCAGRLSRMSVTPVVNTVWLSSVICDGLPNWYICCLGPLPPAPITGGLQICLILLLPPLTQAPVLLATTLWVPYLFCEEKAVILLPCSSDFIQNVWFYFFSLERCRNWTGGSFFAHCFEPLSSWQAVQKALCLLFLRVILQIFLLLSPWLSGFGLDTWHSTTQYKPSICHCTHIVQLLTSLLHGFVLGGGSQFLKVWVFFSILLKKATQIFVIMNRRQLLCPLYLVRFFSSPFSQHLLTTCKLGPQPHRHA